ncbi:MAG: hypothetical protein WKF76_01010 [Nocardioidaceae bacterium]
MTQPPSGDQPQYGAQPPQYGGGQPPQYGGGQPPQYGGGQPPSTAAVSHPSTAASRVMAVAKVSRRRTRRPDSSSVWWYWP